MAKLMAVRFMDKPPLARGAGRRGFAVERDGGDGQVFW
jgi:hypothetical protein